MLASWDLLILLSRVGLYLGVAGALGACFALAVFRHPERTVSLLRYLQWSSVIGLMAVATNFVSRSAAMSGSFATAFDNVFLTILWQSGAGSSARWQLAGFIALLLGSAMRRQKRIVQRLAIPLMLTAAGALLWSFTFTGHFATQPWFSKLALALHVLAMALWLGSFYPLLVLLSHADGEHNLKRFSSLGVWIVALLLSCGLWMAWMLVGDFTRLVTTTYGWVLLGKLGLLIVLLALAAANKWIFVPRYIADPSGIRRSIQGEILVGFGILIVTAVLANLVSPS